MEAAEKKNIELLAPAGDFESLMAAIQGGADSVYFGVGSLNMRVSSTKNFRPEDLRKIREIGDQHGIKVYLTLNTVIYDSDMEETIRLLDLAKKNRVDAIIASDFSVIKLAREKQMPVHISTQANISNFEALKFFSEYGEVVVLARELSLAQITDICTQVNQTGLAGPSGKPVRIEIFIHGALCMSISGKCYLSLHEKNKSANRGECMQLCRRGYTVTEKDDNYQLDIDNEYIMSPKDLSTIGFIDRILDTGVSVLKIEGRGRAPEYVMTVTSCYRQAIEHWKAGTYNIEVATQLEEKLRSVYNRGFWEGYYLGKKTGEWTDRYGSSATRRKIYIGKITNYFSKPGVAELKIESGDMCLEDDVLVMGPTTGVLETNIREIRVEDLPVESVQKGTICSIPVDQIVRRSDKVYKWIHASEIQ